VPDKRLSLEAQVFCVGTDHLKGFIARGKPRHVPRLDAGKMTFMNAEELCDDAEFEASPFALSL
jgi:hypothetical protein